MSVHFTVPDGLAAEDEKGDEVEERVLFDDVDDDAECRGVEVGFEDEGAGESPDLAMPLMKLDLAS